MGLDAEEGQRQAQLERPLGHPQQEWRAQVLQPPLPSSIPFDPFSLFRVLPLSKARFHQCRAGTTRHRKTLTARALSMCTSTRPDFHHLFCVLFQAFNSITWRWPQVRYLRRGGVVPEEPVEKDQAPPHHHAGTAQPERQRARVSVRGYVGRGAGRMAAGAVSRPATRCLRAAMRQLTAS